MPPTSQPPHARDLTAQITARWVWPDRLVSVPWNQYALFRREFNLPRRPRRALARVSADARYRLFVNGQPVHYGPARSFHREQCVDEIDLSGLLVEGPNVVAAIGHQFGLSTFQSQFRDASGFLFDCQVEFTDGPPVPLHTPDGWLSRTSRAWRRDVARMAIQMGWQEHFDAERDPPGWMLPGYAADEASGWRPPQPVGPAGVHPWTRLVARSVPLLTATPSRFGRVVGVFGGENARGHKVATDIYKLVESEAVKKAEPTALTDPAAVLVDDDAVATVAPPPSGQFTALLFETEGYCTGHFVLDIAEAAGGEIVDIVYNESLADRGGWMHFNSVAGGGATTAGRYRCRAGAQRWETFHFVGTRFVALVFRNLKSPLKLRYAGMRRVHAGVHASAGAFECADPTLNAIWSMCRETQLACLLDTFVDCPWREQAMWWGDARVQARVSAHAFGDTSVLEYGIRLMAMGQSDDDGSLHAHPPSDWPSHRLPDFMCTWVSTLWDHYWLTGRIDLIRSALPSVHRLFEFLAGHARADGLIGGFDGWWVFLDWAELYKDDYSAVLNLFYLQAATHAVELCQLAGDRPAADRYRALAERLRQAIVDCFWDEKEKRFRDGLDADKGLTVEKVSQQANTLAILLGLKPEHHAVIARDVLLKPARQAKPSVVTATPFFYAYVLEALCAAGLRREAIELIRTKWGRWVEEGYPTCAETWKDRPLSHCHAWSASPLYLLVQQVLGVTAVEPGWKKLRIAPLPGKLEFARGVVPTPHGPVKVDWEQPGEDQLAVRIELPAGVEAEFIGPAGGAPRGLRPGVHEFQA